MPAFTELWTRVPIDFEVSAQNSGVTGVLIAEGDSAVGSEVASHGSRGLEMSFLGPGAGATRISWDQAEAGRYVLSFFFRLTQPVTAFEDLAGLRHAGGYMGILNIGMDQKLVVSNAGGQGVSGSRAPNPLPLNDWIRVDLAVRKGTGTADGYLGFAYWTNNGTVLAHSWESSAVNTGTANVAQVFVGRTTGRAQARTIHYGLVRGATQASGWLPVYDVATAPPVLTMGLESRVEPGTQVSLNINAEDPAGGAVTVAVAQTAGAPVTISGGTYIAPATLGGTALDFLATATKAGGIQSTATTRHTILQATEAAIVDGELKAGFWRLGRT